MPTWQKERKFRLSASLSPELESAVHVCSQRAGVPCRGPRTWQSRAVCRGRPCLVKPILCQVPTVLLQKSDFGRGGRKCLMETGSPSDSCAEECGAGGGGRPGPGSAPSVFKGTLWIDLLSKKITKQVGKLLRKLSSETFPSYSLLICLPCFIGLLLLS